MKKPFVLSCSLVFALFLLLSSFVLNTPSKAVLDEHYQRDFQFTVESESLNDRFERQFHFIFSEVQQVDVHYNAVNGYYYAVYGIDAKEQAVVDLFKTTEQEVSQKIYNYISEESMASASGVCREFSSGDELRANGYCSPSNSGVSCAPFNNGRCGPYY